jgi:predicted transcriptional regulator
MEMSPGPATTPPALHELEAEVMEQMWQYGGEASARAVLDALNARTGKQRAYTTVATTLLRLESKGMLRRRRHGRTDLFEAALGEEEYVAARARAHVAELVDAYGEGALAHFAAAVDELDAARRQRLRALRDGDA